MPKAQASSGMKKKKSPTIELSHVRRVKKQLRLAFLALTMMVLVGAIEKDINGDGILNAEESCVFVSAVDTGTGRDGTDNACEDTFSPPSIPPEEIIEMAPEPVALPTIRPIESKPTPNNETVAGNEELATIDPAEITAGSVAIPAQQQVAAQVQQAPSFIPEERNQSVLGASSASQNSNPSFQNEPKQLSVANTASLATTLPKESNVRTWLIAGGMIVMMAVAFMAVRLRLV